MTALWHDLKARLRVWYETSMANRVALRSQGVAAGALLVATVIFYPLTARYITETAELRVRLATTLLAERLESELERALGEMDRLSHLSLVGNALADASGNQGHLRPFLAEYGRNVPEMSIPALVDANGTVLAGDLNAEELAEFRSGRPLDEMPHLHFIPAISEARLYMHFPVRYVATGTVEGVLVTHLDLDMLLKRLVAETALPGKLPLNISLRDGSGMLKLRQASFSGPSTSPVVLDLNGPFAKRYHLSIQVEATTDPEVAYRPLILVTVVLLVVIVVLLWVVMLIARRFSARDVEPLREMGSRAMEIASAGPGGLRELEVVRSDEVGWMGTAFNEMVYSLRCVYDRQEEVVAKRTRELDAAREHLRSVLDGVDDVVYALSRDGGAVDYISASAARVFGYAPKAFLQDPALFSRIILEEDRALFTQGLSALEGGHLQEVRYRIRHADGSIRLVINRMNLILDNEGLMNRIGGLVRDITEAVEAENQLHLQERALASSSCGVVISDMKQPGQPVIYVNESFERITGYSSAEVLGHNCNLLQHEGDDLAALGEIRDAIRSGHSCKVVLKNWRKDGSPFWNELSLSPLFNEAGEITHYIGIQNDISASVAATQALVESEHRLALTVEALHEGIWDWNVVTNTLVTSPSWARVLGLDPDQVKGSHTLDTFLARLSPMWRERLMDALAQHFASGNEDFYFEHQCELPDGHQIWAASHGRVVEMTPEGKPLRMVGSIVDISDRIQSTERIIRLMSQLDVILTLSPDGIIYFDEQGKISFVNRAFERMTGIQAGEATGLDRLELDALLRGRADPAQTFPDCFAKEVCGCSDDKSAGSCLMYMQKPRHSVLQVSVHEPTSGNSIVVYLRDVTRETEVDRMKSEFLSTAAHELRTPMTSIMGYVELMRMREFDRESSLKIFDTIHRQARRLTDLINELLDLARIEARGGKVFNMQDVQPGLVLQEAIGAMKAMNGESGAARMQVQIDDDLPSIEGDPAKLQQAFLNIISNAYKYSPDGGAIEIQAVQSANGERLGVDVSVRDHGIGMTPADLSRVFERFFRADGSGNIPGTGLGMSLVKEIVTAHHGEIQVDSELGEGTVVRIWLPTKVVAVASEERVENPSLTASHLGELTLWLDEGAAQTANTEGVAS